MITRFSVIPDERGLILGVDKAGVFEPGQVYEIVKVLDEIVIRKVGKFSLAPSGSEYPNCNSEMDAIAYSGLHLITDEERKNLK
ncbi:MAG TPA: hypothetical protein PK122_02195 [Candidatus Paceibacterota bacterium]|nr:hypothetical protein [Candidatus Paceibacterota bacterium]